jgi:hypothetical protein
MKGGGSNPAALLIFCVSAIPAWQLRFGFRL